MMMVRTRKLPSFNKENFHSKEHDCHSKKHQGRNKHG